MNTKTLSLIAALTAASVPATAGTFLGLRLNFGGPVYAPAPVVYEPPPTVVIERTPPPAPGYVWIAGHWDWDGRGWVWHNGLWQLPPQASAQWSPGHWMKSSQGWAWADGAWIVPSPPPPPASAPQPPAPPPPPMADDVVVAQPPPAPLAETDSALPITRLCLDRRLVGVARFLGLVERLLLPSARQPRRMGARLLGPPRLRVGLEPGPLALSH